MGTHPDIDIPDQRTDVNGGFLPNGETVALKVTAITLANPAVVTVQFPHFLLRNEGALGVKTAAPTGTISGVTGSGDEVPINAAHVMTLLTATTFSIPIDTTAKTFAVANAIITIDRDEITLIGQQVKTSEFE